jgi:hypothetical protein
METGIPTSFIPHDATTVSRPREYESEGGLGSLLSLVALVFFIASAALGAGAFLYQQYLTGESASKKASLEKAKAAFEPALIEQLTRLDDRMNFADKIVGVHIAPSAFFSALNQITLANVSFSSLDFTATDPQSISIKMAGSARSVNSIALQADLFTKSGIIKNAIFSNINQQQGSVNFSVVGQINPAAINYAGLVSGQAPAGVNQLPVPSSTTDQQPTATLPSGDTTGASPQVQSEATSSTHATPPLPPTPTRRQR